MALPIDVRDLIKSGSQIQEEREKPVRLAVFVEVDAPQELVDLAQARFRPYTANAVLHVEVAEKGSKLLVDPSADAVVCLVGGGSPSLAESLAEARSRAVPAVAVALTDDTAAVADRLGHPYGDTIGADDVFRAVDIELSEWLVERVWPKRLALAHNFEFLRRAVAAEHVKNTAFQNALIGAIAFFPGADMPIMTANQSKMLLQIAAAYGEQLGAERWKELAGVVGGAFVLRTVARQGVAFLPGFGWAIKAGIGYSGTIAMGFAAIRYFENGADLGDLGERLERYGDEIKHKLSSMSRKELRRAAAGADAETPAADATVPPVLPPAEESSRSDA